MKPVQCVSMCTQHIQESLSKGKYSINDVMAYIDAMEDKKDTQEEAIVATRETANKYAELYHDVKTLSIATAFNTSCQMSEAILAVLLSLAIVALKRSSSCA